jgi:hypothetical protein
MMNVIVQVMRDHESEYSFEAFKFLKLFFTSKPSRKGVGFRADRVR